LLNADAVLPVAIARAPTRQDIRIHGGRLVERAPVEGPPWTALAVGQRIHEVALRDVIAASRCAHRKVEAVRPRAIVRGDERRARVVDGVGVAGPRTLEVLRDVPLERRLPVAEHIVGDTKPRRDVMVTMYAFGAWKQERATELVVGNDAVLSGRGPTGGALVPQGTLKRQPLTRPLVLDVEAVVAKAVAGLVRSHALRQLIRHAVVEPIADLPAHVGDVLRVHVTGLVAPLHAVLARDVRHRGLPCRVHLIARWRRIEPAIDEIRERYADTGGLLGHRNEVRQHAVGSR